MAPEEQARLTIFLEGHFRILSSDGEDRTPVSRKAQALIALLATETHHTRTRIWLQDKLWSTNDKASGSANLRQCLSTIRRALGPYRDLLGSNKASVWLKTSEITVKPDCKSDGYSASFLEGIDIADSEFNTWLQGMRLADTPQFSEPHKPFVHKDPGKWQVVLLGERTATSQAYHLEAEFLTILARNLSEYGSFQVEFGSDDEPHERMLEVSVRAVPMSGQMMSFRATATQKLTRRTLWAETVGGTQNRKSMLADFDILGMAFRVQSALVNAIEEDTRTPATQFLLGPTIKKVFSFHPDRLREVRETLDAATQQDNAATILGWQAQITIIEVAERFAPDIQLAVEQGLEFSARAIEADTMNSMALCTAANAQVLLGRNADAGHELATLALRVNPTNPLCWVAHSIALLYSGQGEQALQAAHIGAKLAARTNLQFWCEFQLGLAALHQNDLEQACRSMETSAALSPRFRPPLRYLLATYVRLGDFDRANRALDRLKKLEGDFTLDQFLLDEGYPISLARRQGLLNPSDFSPLMG